MGPKTAKNSHEKSLSFMAGRDNIYMLTRGLDPSGPDEISIADFPAGNAGKEALNNAVMFMKEKTGKNYALINCVIPDTMVAFESFSSGGAPNGGRLKELLAYKTARKLGLDPKDAMFRLIKTGAGGNLSAAGFSVSAGLVNDTAGILGSHGLALSAAVPAIVCVIGGLKQRMDLDDAAVFVSDGEYWTFALCPGKNAVPGFMLSRWYDSGGIVAAFTEVERKLRAYFSADPDAGFKKIIICCASAEMASKAAAAAAGRFETEIITEGPPDIYAGNGRAFDMPFSLLSAGAAK